MPNKVDSKRATPKYIIIKITKKNLKATRERHLVTYKGAPIRPSAVNRNISDQKGLT